MSLPPELYPFATQEGKAVPLEIIKPIAALKFSFTTTIASLVLPVSLNLSAIFSTEDCFIDLANVITAITSGVTYDNLLFIPKETVVMVMLPTATVKVKGDTAAGDLYIQGIQKWASMHLPRQFTGKAS